MFRPFFRFSWMFCLGFQALAAQSPSVFMADDLGLNQQKYWQYRQRFLGDSLRAGFIDLGLGPGQSIPASGRNPAIDCSNDWHLVHGLCPLRQGRGMMEWGDATVYLGYYLAVLALEYRLLQEAGQPTEATGRELSLALSAYERLDEQAEVVLGLPPSRNGFFLRDDVASDFYLKPDAKGRFAIDSQQFYACIRSDGACGGDLGAKLQRGTFVSQDQIIALFLGFAFVAEFVPDTLPGDTLSAGARVGLYTDEIMTYLRRWNWIIHTPDGRRIPERWGSNVQAFNYPLALAAQRITRGQFRAKGYQKGNSRWRGRSAYGSTNWAFGIQAQRNRAMIYKLAILCQTWSDERMSRRAWQTDQMVYGLAQAVLNAGDLQRPLSRQVFYELILSAPPDGPCFQSPGCQAPEGWNSFDRWFHAYHKNGNPYGRAFEFNGLDFMFLYNLYHYRYRALLPAYRRG